MMQMEFQDTPYTLFLGLVFFARTTRTSLVTNFTAAPHTRCGLLYSDPTWGRRSFHWQPRAVVFLVLVTTFCMVILS